MIRKPVISRQDPVYTSLSLAAKNISRMTFNGKYELQSHENFEAFMKAIGVPEELIEKAKDLKTVTEIVQDGKHFKVTGTTGSKVLINEFNIGEEAELEAVTGEKDKSVVNLVDGNKLVSKLKGITSTSEVSGDILTNTMTLGDITYKGISKRV